MMRQRHQRPAPGGLRRRQAIPLAIGSIAGSGILFLPSAVYVEAGRNSLLVWALSTLVCLPMLLMFEDMVRASPDGTSIQAFIQAGLGEVVGRCVPLLFLSLVVVGLPAGSLVAGRYVARALGAGPGVTMLVGVSVLLVALAANLAGVRSTTRVQQVGSWALVAMAVVLLASAATGRGTGWLRWRPTSAASACCCPGWCWPSGRSPGSRTSPSSAASSASPSVTSCRSAPPRSACTAC
jgi:amino acid efflux transporter